MGSFFLIEKIKTNDGTTIIVVIIKNKPQFPFNQSTSVPEEDANRVLPAVPTEANSAYCVAV